LVYGGGAVGAQIIGNASYAQMQVTAAGANTNSYFTFGANGTGTGKCIIQRNATDVVTIDASGNVGIGTSSPAVTLHVDASGGGAIRAGRSSVSGEYIQMDHDGTNGTLRATGASGSLAFVTNSAERARIDASGNVGIGTSSPAQKVDVVGGNIRVNSASESTVITNGANFTTGAVTDSALTKAGGASLLFGTGSTGAGAHRRIG
jgi:hypothetical protein